MHQKPIPIFHICQDTGIQNDQHSGPGAQGKTGVITKTLLAKPGIDLISNYLIGHLLQHHFFKLLLKEIIKIIYDSCQVPFPLLPLSVPLYETSNVCKILLSG